MCENLTQAAYPYNHFIYSKKMFWS